MSAPFPIESLQDGHRGLGLVFAVVVGTAFGFVLERGGLGRPRKLMGQFHGDDMTVLRVLFTAIVTAMVGAAVLGAAGILDLGLVQDRYPTFLWPMIAGGFVLGVGFVVSGYCPGTCMVGAGAAKLDAVVTIVGLALGGLANALVEPAMGGFASSGALGIFTLPQWLGLPVPVVVVAVLALALGAFAAAGRIERLVRSRSGAAVAPPSPSSPQCIPARAASLDLRAP